MLIKVLTAVLITLFLVVAFFPFSKAQQIDTYSVGIKVVQADSTVTSVTGAAPFSFNVTIAYLEVSKSALTFQFNITLKWDNTEFLEIDKVIPTDSVLSCNSSLPLALYSRVGENGGEGIVTVNMDVQQASLGLYKGALQIEAKDAAGDQSSGLLIPVQINVLPSFSSSAAPSRSALLIVVIVIIVLAAAVLVVRKSSRRARMKI